MVIPGMFSKLRNLRIGRHANERRRIARDSSGSIAVPFALGLPIALTAVFGMIELGRLGFTQAALQYAASEATRYAIVGTGQVSTEDIESYAASKLNGVIDRDIAVITAVAPLDPVTGTSLISVEASYEYRFILPFLPVDGITLSGSSRGFLAFPPNVPE